MTSKILSLKNREPILFCNGKQNTIIIYIFIYIFNKNFVSSEYREQTADFETKFHAIPNTDVCAI